MRGVMSIRHREPSHTEMPVQTRVRAAWRTQASDIKVPQALTPASPPGKLPGQWCVFLKTEEAALAISS